VQTFIIAASASVISLGVGAFLGYKYAERRLSEEYEVRLKVEINKTKAFYTKLAKKAEYSDPTNLAEEIIESEHYIPADGSEDTEELDSELDRHVPFNYAKEVPKREGQRRYVISFEEMKENPKDYDQRTITYYEKDDVLVDERDTPIDDIDGLIGLENLEQFGNGSKDPNIVYIRNDFLAMDLEVIREFESYEETVLGSIKHSNQRRPRKFRIDDD
jgi:hypothetical protein